MLVFPVPPVSDMYNKGKLVIPLQAGVVQRVGRGIALLFHDRGTRRGWVVSSTLRPHFTSGKDSVPILQEVGWAAGPVWTGGKSRPHRNSIPDPPSRSQSLYWLSYPTHDMYSTYSNLQVVILFVVQSGLRAALFKWVMLLPATRFSCCHSHSRWWVTQIIKLFIVLFESVLLICSIQIIN